MPGSLRIWIGIFQNPFSGYGQIKKDTRIAWPLSLLLLLVVGSTTLILPVSTSPVYTAAAARMQRDILSQRGAEMDEAQSKALQDQLASPMVRTITIGTAYVGGLFGYTAMLLALALLLKIVTLAFKASVPYKHLFAILVFTGVVTAVQGLLKAGITLAGDWQGALRHAQNMGDLAMALRSSLSLALLVPFASLGKAGFALLDTATDIFNWIYFVFLYAGMKASAGLDKGRALAVTLLTAALFLGLSVGLSVLF